MNEVARLNENLLRAFSVSLARESTRKLIDLPCCGVGRVHVSQFDGSIATDWNALSEVHLCLARVVV